MDQRTEETARPERVVTAPAGLPRGLPLPWWLVLGTRLGLAAVGLGGRRRAPPADLAEAPQAWLARAEALLGRPPRSLLQLGPGRMVLRAPVLAGLGLDRVWFLEAQDRAPADPGLYQAVAAEARARGIPAPNLAGCVDRGAILARSRARLLLGGPAALSAIPGGTVDLIVSDGVLQHVRREELAPLLAQLRRVAAPDALGLHVIDFRDHLSGGVQHLRFSDAFWSNPLVGRAGVYVNRLGLSAMVSRFRRAGFRVAVREAVVWQRRPPGPRRPHPEAMRPAADDLVAQAVLEVRPG